MESECTFLAHGLQNYTSNIKAGMEYWFTDVSVEPIFYQHFFEYRVSVNVTTDNISGIGFG